MAREPAKHFNEFGYSQFSVNGNKTHAQLKGSNMGLQGQISISPATSKRGGGKGEFLMCKERINAFAKGDNTCKILILSLFSTQNSNQLS